MTTTQINHARTQATNARGSTKAAAALLSAGLAGLVLAWAMPRGPMTQLKSLAALGLGIGVGVLAGWLMATPVGRPVGPRRIRGGFEIGADRGRRPHRRRDPPRRLLRHPGPGGRARVRRPGHRPAHGRRGVLGGSPRPAAEQRRSSRARRRPARLRRGLGVLARRPGDLPGAGHRSRRGPRRRPGPPGPYRPHPRRGRRTPARQHRRADHRSDRRARPVDHAARP